MMYILMGVCVGGGGGYLYAYVFLWPTVNSRKHAHYKAS